MGDGNHCMSSETLFKITVCEHKSPCQPQTQLKAPSCKEHNPETLSADLKTRETIHLVSRTAVADRVE